MSTLTIRKIDDELKEKLRIRAAHHGHSMEAEVREILRSALESPVQDKGLGTLLHKRFMAAGFGEVNIELPERDPWAPTVDFSE